MFRNYFKVTIRSLLKNKVYALINIFGLSISLTVCLLIIKIIFNIYSCDRFHVDKHEIYRVTTVMNGPNFDLKKFATSSGPVAEALASYQGVSDVIQLWNVFHDFGKVNELSIPVRGYFADEKFFEFFSFALKYGNSESVLQTPYSAVISEELSMKLFENENPIGKTIQFKNYGTFTVSGVICDDKYKSQMRFELIASSNTLQLLEKPPISLEKQTRWDNAYVTYTYCKLNKGMKAQAIESQLNKTASINAKNNGQYIEFGLQSLLSISPGSPLSNELGSVESEPIELIFIAILLIITSGFTYSNLSVAKSFARAKEVGIRKLNGATKSQVFMQFIMEAVMLSLVSLLIAYFLLDLLIPVIRSAEPAFSSLLTNSYSLSVYLTFLSFALFLGVVTGAFPALYISKFQTANIVKSVDVIGKKTKFNFKKAIITFQFFVSLLVLFIIITLYQQLDHQEKVDIGFNPGNVINVNLEGADYYQFKNRISRFHGVNDVSGTNCLPGIGDSPYSRMVYHDGSSDPIVIKNLSQSSNFINNMEIEILAGKGFSGREKNTRHGYVINRSCAEFLGYEAPNMALNHTLRIDDFEEKEIIGVVENFVVTDLTSGSVPLIITSDTEHFDYANIRLGSMNSQKDFLTFLKKEWIEVDPYLPLEYHYYPEMMGEQEANSNKLMSYLAIVTAFIILIAVLGLLGIVMYDTQTRTKEIGIRKIMGADLQLIIWTLTRNYLKMILAAAFIAIPIAWLINMELLNIFYYKVKMNPLWFVVGVVFMLFVGGITALTQSLKTANKNPVETLRHDK